MQKSNARGLFALDSRAPPPHFNVGAQDSRNAWDLSTLKWGGAGRRSGGGLFRGWGLVFNAYSGEGVRWGDDKSVLGRFWTSLLRF